MTEGKNRLLIGKAIPLPVLPLNSISAPWVDHKGQDVPPEFVKELDAQMVRLLALPGVALVGLTVFRKRLAKCQTVDAVNAMLMDLYAWCDQKGVLVPWGELPG